MAKKKKCEQCNCERNITLTSNVTVHNAGNEIILQYKRLCIPCLLSVLNLCKEPRGEFDYEKAMSCVE